MIHALADTTRTAPNGGAETETLQTEDVTVCRAPILQGLIAWLPALVILVGMPLLALATTKYFVLPTMKRVYSQEAAADQGGAPLFLAKVTLDASVAQGAHSGFRSVALIGADSGFKEKVNQNKNRLMDLAAGDLKGKTLSDLDKPGALEALRAQLLADFNHALGGPFVKEVYIAVWPPH
jgi:flagellar basal body-associated protein FliL